MRKKTFNLSFAFLAPLFLAGCYVDPEYNESQQVTGYIPVYGPASANEIVMTQARSVEDPGKIYRYGSYLLVNEKKKGIHVFDNSNPAAPSSIGFIQLLGNTDMAIKNGVLYADHLGNLVALTTNDFTAIEEKGRLPLRNWNRGIPPPAGFYFECVNPDKGLVVSWKKAELENPQCYAIQ